MPNYVHKKLVEYEHKSPKRPQHCPHAPPRIKYGKESNLLNQEEISPPATEEEKKYIQKVLGSFLFYARAIDMTILHSLSAIASEQSKPTKKTLERIKQLLDYMATHPDAIVRFYASDMVLNLHSDASCLLAGQGRSGAGGYFFL